MIKFDYDDKHSFSILLDSIEEKENKDKEKIKKIVNDTTIKISNTARDYLKQKGHIVSGALYGSIKEQCLFSNNDFIGIVKAGASHAIFLEEGTRAHIIKPKKASCLRFYGKNGKPVFAKKVHHPGTDPSPFMETALNLNVLDFIIEVEEEINKWT